MLVQSLNLLLVCVAFTSASPAHLHRRVVKSLNEAATAEAHTRDDTATRAFSDTAIKTSDGQCLFVDELSGDFRANLNPIGVAACDGSAGQKWDIITKGEHISVAGAALFVNTLTQACLNFDDRRAEGNKVIMFSCGGRADGEGIETNSQQIVFDGGAEPQALTPLNAPGTCFGVKGTVLDKVACDQGDATQSFTFGGAGGDAGAEPATPVEEDVTSPSPSSPSPAPLASPSTAPVDSCAGGPQ
ncbi:MAG: hypothetical protein M1825_004805 [Sarcosagium campestre]|nr:MAG: hypothetical protein M1825_004805 [Sarcosagium campestre]